jgi:hypothetical protein
MKKGLIWFCRIFVGLLFIFSGLIKINDPLGFSYKLVEYFEVSYHLFKWIGIKPLYYSMRPRNYNGFCAADRRSC